MKLFLVALALAIGATAQSTTTVLAPCGTDCPTAVPDKSITRTRAVPSESPCPSLIVSSISGGSGGNGSNPSATGAPTAAPSPFTGGAGQVAGSVGAAAAAIAAILVL